MAHKFMRLTSSLAIAASVAVAGRSSNAIAVSTAVDGDDALLHNQKSTQGEFTYSVL